MAAGDFTLYSNAALEIGDGTFDLASDTYFMVLCTTSYTPAPNTDSTYANVSGDEVANGDGYTTGGEKLTGTSWALSTATCTFTCTAPTWADFSATFRYAVIIRAANGSSLQSTDKLLCYVDCTGGGSITGGGGTLTITPNADGIFTLTHSP